MAVPAGFAPYVTSHRRYLFLRERDARRRADHGVADAFRAVRLAAPGTALWRRVPSRDLLAAADVLALEEVIGAGVDELRAYGLDRRRAETLITFCEGVAATMTTFQYGPRAGEIYDQDSVVLMASTARTASATSDTYEVGDRGTLRLALDVTAFTGTSLHVQVETREAYGSGTWRVVDAFPLATGVATTYRTFAGCDAFVRVVCDFVGTTATYSVSGTGV